MESVAPFKEVIDEVREKGGDAVKFCYQCGKCDTVCPWNRVRTFSMRKLIREATFGLTEVEREEIWRCTTCGKCPQRCPRDVKQIDDMVPCAGWRRDTVFFLLLSSLSAPSAQPLLHREPLRRRTKKQGRVGRGSVCKNIRRRNGDAVFPRLLPQL